MTMFTKILAGGASIAALATAAPAAAQYYPYQANPYGYANPYGNAYGYNANMTQYATQRCAAVVQSRLSNRTGGGLSGILGAVLGANTMAQGRILSYTRIEPRRTVVRVRGLATSGRMAYNPYGYGAYGAVGYAYQPDLSFKCDVDYRGRVVDVDINRR